MRIKPAQIVTAGLSKAASPADTHRSDTGRPLPTRSCLSRATDRRYMDFSRHPRTNMSRLDRVLRTGIGACLVYTAFVVPWLVNIPSINLAMGTFGLMNIASAMIGVCPGYMLAKVSTLRGPSPERSTEDGSDEDHTTEGVTASLRNKLMLCIVLPGVLAATVFGVVLHQFASDLVTTELTAEGRAVALLATRQHGSDTSLLDGSPEKAGALKKADLSDALTGLVLHDQTGRQVQHALQKLPDTSFPIDDLLRAVGTDLTAPHPREQGRWHTPTSDLSWVAVRVPGKKLWYTAIMDSRDHNAMLALLLGPRMLALVLIMLWMTLWGAIYNVRKYTQRMAADARELRYRSLHDPLTGLLNRMGLDDVLQRHFSAPLLDQRCTTFVVIDLIGFRAINDSFGHVLADQLLCEVADRIRTAVPKECCVFRMGGDTFGILCTGFSEPEHEHLLLQRLQHAVDSSYPIDTMSLTLNSRAGVAYAPHDTRDVVELVRFADLALSRAKRTHTTHCHYEPDEDTRSVRRLTLMSALRDAIDKDALNLVYQPKISLSDGTLSGVEALARWNHPDYGAVSPEEFVSLAERAGLIDDLTRWVLLSAERQCAVWRAGEMRIPIAVNLSPLNLKDPAFPGLVEQLVSNGDFTADLLELELTENAVMEDADLAMERLSALSELGVTLSIDDFGSGQSSFAYLQRFPVSNLKIDRQFVMTLASDTGGNDTLLLRSMIELGHNMGLVVTAEGVEDETSLKRLQELGCDYAQGYHIARPMAPDALQGWLDYRSDVWSEAA